MPDVKAWIKMPETEKESFKKCEIKVVDGKANKV